MATGGDDLDDNLILNDFESETPAAEVEDTGGYLSEEIEDSAAQEPLQAGPSTANAADKKRKRREKEKERKVKVSSLTALNGTLTLILEKKAR